MQENAPIRVSTETTVVPVISPRDRSTRARRNVSNILPVDGRRAEKVYRRDQCRYAIANRFAVEERTALVADALFLMSWCGQFRILD